MRILKWSMIAVFSMVAIFVVGKEIWSTTRASEYRSFSSPDDRFKIVVFRVPKLFAMPGGSGDAPGFVRLVDSGRGRTVKQKRVKMVQLVDQVEWSATNVDVRLITTWELPK